MCAIYPSIWMKHLNKTGIIILKKWRFPFKANVMHRIEQEVWTLLKGAFHFSTYCMFLHSREDLVFRAIVLNKWSLSWKMVTLKNTIGRLSCLLEEISSRQIVTCKQHVPLTTTCFFPGMKQFASTIALLDSNTGYWSHTAHCVEIWCMIEGRLNIILKRSIFSKGSLTHQQPTQVDLGGASIYIYIHTCIHHTLHPCVCTYIIYLCVFQLNPCVED